MPQRAVSSHAPQNWAPYCGNYTTGAGTDVSSNRSNTQTLGVIEKTDEKANREADSALEISDGTDQQRVPDH